MLKRALIVLSLFSLLTSHALLAQNGKGIGIVILTSGAVEASDKAGATRSLTRKSELFVGDTVKVGAAGKAQIKFTDSSLMTLQEKTEFRVDTYQNDGKDTDNFGGSLVKGSFRTLTGAIGKTSKDSYQVKTPVAVMGVRGTAYQGSFDGDKLIVACYQGVCTIENEEGSMEIGLDQRFNICEVETDSPPEGLLAEPISLEESEELASEEESGEPAGESREDEAEPDLAFDEGEVEPLSHGEFADIEAAFEDQNVFDEEEDLREIEIEEDLQTELHEECVGHECDLIDDDPSNDSDDD